MVLQIARKGNIQDLLSVGTAVPVNIGVGSVAPQNVIAPTQPYQAPVPQPQNPLEAIGSFFKTDVIPGFQQSGGLLGDIGIQAGSLLAQPKPWDNSKQADIMRQVIAQTAQNARNTLHGLKDINGNPIAGTSSVDQNATNITQGKGNAQDFAAVAGKGLETGVAASMFVNPALIAKDAAGNIVKATTGQVIKHIIGTSAVLGGSQGVSTGLETYGSTGDVGKAITQGLQSAATSTATNALLGGTGYVAGKTVKSLRDANASPEGQRGSIQIPGGKSEPIPVEPTPQVSKPNYQSAHQIDTATSRNLGDITSVDDIVGAVKSKYGLTNYDNKDIVSLKKIIGNPEADVKIYRSSPINEINNGDWVTTSKTYANDIKAQNGGKVYEYTVKAKDLNLPQNIEDNPSLARFSAFQYNKSTVAPQVSKTGLKVTIKQQQMNDTAFQNVFNTHTYRETGKLVTESSPVTIKQARESVGGSPDQVKIANARLDANKTPPPQSMLAKDNVPLNHKYEAPRTVEENTALNPVKTNIPDVVPGNPEQIRVNSQLASEPIRYEANLGARLARKLSPEEKQNFGQLVEGTMPIKSEAAQRAVDAYQRMTNQAHSINQSLGGNTNYKQNYFHREWDLSDPKMAEKYDQALQKASYVDPYAFKGINSQPQAFRTIAEGEQAGFHLLNKGDPAKSFENYGNSASYALRQQAIRKGIDQADQLATSKPVTFDLGNGESVPVSKELAKGLKGVSNHNPSDNVVVKGLRNTNKLTKQVVLGGSQFHTTNIGMLRAGPELALSGHPIRALKGIGSMYLSQASPKFNDYLRIKAAQDGLPEFAARIGMPYGSNDFASSGVSSIAGHGLIFGKAMPAMQDQMLRAIKSDFEKKGISFDSPEAHQAGLVGNKVLGFLNTTVQNLDPRAQRAVSDWVFAPQFTRSGLELFKDSFKGGLGGRYARSAIVGNVLATTAAIGAIGAATGQTSDDLRDLLLRALIDPAIPTPFKDNKGNTIKFRTPGTLTSMVAKLLGIGLERGQDGHLGVTWDPTNLPTSIEDFARSHLSELPATVLKIATNTNYAGKPLYDPNASLGTKIAQGATSVATGLLPIGAQSIPYIPGVKALFPNDVQAVLNANTPGTDPVLKSLASSLGATATTDNTVGQGLSTKRYYDQLNQAKQGLDRQAADAIDLYTGSKKNPVTGAYDVQPNGWYIVFISMG